MESQVAGNVSCSLSAAFPVALRFNECNAQLFIKKLSNSQNFLAVSSQLTCSLFATYLCPTFKVRLSCRMTASSQSNLVSHSVADKLQLNCTALLQFSGSSTLIFSALRFCMGCLDNV